MLCAQHKLSDLMPLAEERLKHIMGVEKSRIVLKHPKQSRLYNISHDGEINFFPICGIIGSVMDNGNMANITNGYAHPLFNGSVDIESSMPILCMPIKHPKTDRIIGAIEVVNARGIQGLSASHKAKINAFDSETLEFFARQFAQATLNCELWERKQAELDKKPYYLDSEDPNYRLDPVSSSSIEDN
jgi:hypothetical protein